MVKDLDVYDMEIHSEFTFDGDDYLIGED